MIVHLLPMLQEMTGQLTPDQVAAATAAGGIIGIVYLVLLLLMIVGLWKTFTKAGEPGWASIVPVYNIIVALKLAGRPAWWVVLIIFPCTSLIFMIIAGIDFAKAFGKGGGFGVGLALLPFIFLPMLGFSDARYVGTKTA